MDEEIKKRWRSLLLLLPLLSVYLYYYTGSQANIAMHRKVRSVNYFSEHQLSFRFILRLPPSGRAHTKACREETLSDLCTHQHDGRQAVLLWSLALGGSKSLNKQCIPLEEWKCFLLFKKKQTNKQTKTIYFAVLYRRVKRPIHPLVTSAKWGTNSLAGYSKI